MSPKGYTPYRIAAPFEVSGPDRRAMRRKYPHAGRIAPSRASRRQFVARFEPGVVNSPTPAERALFLRMPKAVVAPIPQDPRGFDRRDSGVARSFQGGVKGRRDAAAERMEREAREAAEAKRAATKAPPAPEPEPAPEPAVVPRKPRRRRVPGAARLAKDRKTSPATRPRADTDDKESQS